MLSLLCSQEIWSLSAEGKRKITAYLCKFCSSIWRNAGVWGWAALPGSVGMILRKEKLFYLFNQLRCISFVKRWRKRNDPK